MMKTLGITLLGALLCWLAPEVVAAVDGPLCVESQPHSSSVDLNAPGALLQRLAASRLLVDADSDAPSAASLEGDVAKQGDGVHYSISESMTAAMSYHHAFLYDTASNDELRADKFSNFSTARERDVIGLGMDWRLGDNIFGFGYQLQSTRPDAMHPSTLSIFPGSAALTHAFTLGLTRHWGAAN